MTVRADIDEFLGRKRLLVVGVSRNAMDFTRIVFREFQQRGYDAIPVNPNTGEIAGVRSIARVADADPPVDAALLMTRPEVTESVARECVEAGVRFLWMYRSSGAACRETAAYCRSKGLRVIEGECPLMFLDNPGVPHRVHAFFRRLVGSYPR